jgi:hypothetical protein
MKGLKALVDQPAEAVPAPARTRKAANEAAAALTRNGEEKRDRPDRAGQRLIAAYFDGDTFKSFKILCAEQGATTQSMVSEAIELLFRKYHKPITAQLTEQARQRD